jgi:RNA polymerase sigma factor (sigma-70 family)
LSNLDWRHIEQGDKQAYSEAYVFYYKRFYNYGRKFTGDEALLEDAIQETLMDLWKNKERLSSITFPHTYLFSSFRHILFKKIKQDNRIGGYTDVPEADPEFGIDHLMIRNESDAALKQRLQKALNELTPRQREAIFLRFYEELSYEEVAEVLTISTKATYKIVARALLQLKSSLSLPMLSLLLLLRNTSF